MRNMNGYTMFRTMVMAGLCLALSACGSTGSNNNSSQYNQYNAYIQGYSSDGSDYFGGASVNGGTDYHQAPGGFAGYNTHY